MKLAWLLFFISRYNRTTKDIGTFAQQWIIKIWMWNIIKLSSHANFKPVHTSPCWCKRHQLMINSLKHPSKYFKWILIWAGKNYDWCGWNSGNFLPNLPLCNNCDTCIINLKTIKTIIEFHSNVKYIRREKFPCP